MLLRGLWSANGRLKDALCRLLQGLLSSQGVWQKGGLGLPEGDLHAGPQKVLEKSLC